ncbi:MAG TPA: hypothetical protein VFJ07_24295 [Streptosporangiaceae bacterium]|nr:hypothetical protein [Streptosporangiaceae bacterium]
MALPAALPASAAAAHPAPISAKHLRALYDVGIHPGITAAQARASARAGTTVPEFTATVKVGTKSFKYTIVGKNPAIQVSNASTTVNAVIVPLIMKFSNGDTWDPTKADSCDPGASALARTQNSPIVKAKATSFGGTSVGTVQVTNAFQRAEFWKYAQPTGINPTYGVKLAFKTLSPITINVPNAQRTAFSGTGCGNNLLGAANINWLDPFLQNTVIPSLASQGVGTNTFPIFLLHNFVEYIGNSSQCCVLGYHNTYNVTAGAQTYGLAMYDNSGAFLGSSDISALSHEVGEWQDDPNTVNPTPAWGNIGQVSGCQANLEVGDPLSGTTFNDALGGFTYHPQELAFFSWFYHQKPSLGIHGWYSDQGTFRTFAAPCP